MSERAPTVPAPYPFTPAERARLAAYRAAVAAGFYTDWRCEPRRPHPFTPAEVMRLAAYKAAVAAGVYSEWGRKEGRPSAKLGATSSRASAGVPTRHAGACCPVGYRHQVEPKRMFKRLLPQSLAAALATVLMPVSILTFSVAATPAALAAPIPGQTPILVWGMGLQSQLIAGWGMSMGF